VIEAKVQDWLDAHPEATTTVQDGSITEQKLATSIAQKLGLVTQLSDEIDDIGSDVTDLKSAFNTYNINSADEIKQIKAENKQQDKSLKHLDEKIEEEKGERSQRLDHIVELKKFHLLDNSGNHLINNDNDLFAGLTYLPILDNTFKSDVYPPSSKAVTDKMHEYVGYTFMDRIDEINYKGWNSIPTLYIDNMPQTLLDYNASKSSGTATGVTYRFPMFGINGNFSKVKIQGSSSQTFPKKNYTLTFEDNVNFVPSWGYHKKYVIKSNFNDFTQARNVCAAKLWGNVRRTRIRERTAFLVDENSNYFADGSGNHIYGAVDPQLCVAINCGAVDGFPIMVYMNGEYWGLYCLNVPKDDYMANMGHGDSECILSTNYSSTQAEYFKGLATMEEDEGGYLDFEVEYASEEFEQSAILESINTMLAKVINTHSDYKNEISPYIDFDSAIDYYILCAVIDNLDGIGKNYLLQTWDGVKWYFCAYDLDMILGNINSRGNVYGAPTRGGSFSSLADKHRMFHIIYTYCRDELIARYKYLKTSALSESNVGAVFGRFMIEIPKNVYDYETLRWPQTTGTSLKTYDQICNWYRLRLQYLDDEIHDLEAQNS